MYKHIG
jgi:hypothetical protein